jgi:hypothetical protein
LSSLCLSTIDRPVGNDLALDIDYALIEAASLAIKFLELELQHLLFLALLVRLEVGLHNRRLRDLVALLQVNNMFVLLANDALVLLQDLQEILNLDLQLVFGSAQVRFELMDVLIKSHDFVIFQNYQLVELADFFARLMLLQLVRL